MRTWHVEILFFHRSGSAGRAGSTRAFGHTDVLAGQDQFRITDVHTSSSTALPAFAICEGVLCAQEEGPDTLTLILKPSQAPPFESPVVSYFIYKGVNKGSLLDGDQILGEDDVKATDFTKRIAKEWKKQNDDDLDGSSAALGLDRDADFVHDDGTPDGVHIFTDGDPIERLFSYPHKTVQLPTVAAGEQIGAFDSICGFEVVLQRLGYKPKLGFARSADNQISVASLAGGPWVADDYEFFAHWHTKEQVLAFLDPCAYFGSFVQSKLSKKSGSSATTVKGSNIYQQILQKFANRNVAWLDIRNNYSYSYNLFGLYDDKIRFVAHHGGQTNDINFRSGSWPILRLQIADVPGSKRGSLHRTKLSLPVGQSTAPAVLVSKGFVKNLGPERPKSKAPPIALASPGDTNYTPFRLAFPAIVENSQDVFTASYTRINLYEKPHAATSPAPPLNIAGSEYLDGLFRVRDLQLDEDFAGNSLRFEIYDEEALVDLDHQSGPTYASTVGVAEDANYVTLFAYPSYFLPNDSNLRLNKALPSWPGTAVRTATGFVSRLSNNFRSGTVTKKTFQPDDLPHDVDLIVVSNQSANNYNPITDRNSIENFCFVVLHKANYNSLLGQVLTDMDIDAALPVFLTISISLEKRDAANSVNYIEKILRATGFKMSSSAKAIPVHVSLTEGMIYQNADF